MDIITISITFPRENCALLQRLISYSFFIKFSYSVSFFFFFLLPKNSDHIFFISLNKLIVLAEISDNIVFWVHWFGCDCVHDFFLYERVCELAFRYKFCSILSHYFLLAAIFLLEWVCVCFFFVLFAVIIDYFRFFSLFCFTTRVVCIVYAFPLSL